MCLGQIYKDRIRYCGFLCLKSPENDIHSNNTSLYLEMVRPVPVTYWHPEPPCLVTDIPKRVKENGTYLKHVYTDCEVIIYCGS